MKYRNLSHTSDALIKKLHFLWGKRNIIAAFWWGIKIGQGAKFDGKTVFKRFAKSTIRIGNNCEFLSRHSANLIGINRPCIITTQEETAVIEIGDNCGFSGTVIGAFKSVKIGNNVRCGANVLITDSDWHPDDPRTGEAKAVVIEDNVWLGINVVVLKGVTVGKNSLIGANSLVTKNIPEGVIAAGNPCREISKLP